MGYKQTATSEQTTLFVYHLKNPRLKAHVVAGCHKGGKLA